MHLSGKNGNIPAYSINRVEGTSIYIRNLQPFTGGSDAYSVQFVTQQDRQTALEKARTINDTLIVGKLLVSPCKESIEATVKSITVKWNCQFVTYSLSAYMHVARIRTIGKNLLIDVVYTPTFNRIGMK